MNSFERIRNTFAGEPVDRRPITPILSLYGAKLTGCPLDQYYNDAASFVEGQVAVLETFKPDTVFAPLNFAALGHCFGSEIRYFQDQPPNITKPAVSSYRAWDQIRMPDPTEDPYLRLFSETVRRMAVRFKDELPISVAVPSIVDLPIVILGMDGWMDAVVSDRDAAARILQDLEAWHRKVVRILFDSGASAIAMPCVFASPAIVPSEIVQKMMRPSLERFLSDIGGAIILQHGGAPLLERLSEIAGLPSVGAFALEERDRIDEARRVLGDQTVLFWGIDCARFPIQSAEAIRQKYLAALRPRRDDHRLVLGNSGVDIPWSTLRENIRAIREAAEILAQEKEA